MVKYIWDRRIGLGLGCSDSTSSAVANTTKSPYCLEISKPHNGQAVYETQWLGGSSNGGCGIEILSCGADNRCLKYDLRFVRGINNNNYTRVRFAPGVFNRSDSAIAEAYLGHSGGIRSVRVSPDPSHKFLSTCCDDGSLRIFRTSDLSFHQAKLSQLVAKKKTLVLDEDLEVDMRKKMAEGYTKQIEEVSRKMLQTVGSFGNGGEGGISNIFPNERDGTPPQTDGSDIIKPFPSEAVRSLSSTGCHTLACTSCEWLPLGGGGYNFRILTSSWDQSIAMWDLDLGEDL